VTEWEVTGNLAYRRCCRIEARKVPDAKTMIRLEQLLAGAGVPGGPAARRASRS
jgi:hypothetical protein